MTRHVRYAKAAKGYARDPRGNKIEREYAQRLKILKLAGEIKDYWDFEPISLKIGVNNAKGYRDSWYKPDFMVLNNNNELELHEVKAMKKGKILTEEASAVRYRAVAMMYPFKMIVAGKGKDGWELTEV